MCFREKLTQAIGYHNSSWSFMKLSLKGDSAMMYCLCYVVLKLSNACCN